MLPGRQSSRENTPVWCVNKDGSVVLHLWGSLFWGLEVTTGKYVFEKKWTVPGKGSFAISSISDWFKESLLVTQQISLGFLSMYIIAVFSYFMRNVYLATVMMLCGLWCWTGKWFSSKIWVDLTGNNTCQNAQAWLDSQIPDEVQFLHLCRKWGS